MRRSRQRINLQGCGCLLTVAALGGATIGGWLLGGAPDMHRQVMAKAVQEGRQACVDSLLSRKAVIQEVPETRENVSNIMVRVIVVPNDTVICRAFLGQVLNLSTEQGRPLR